MYFYNKGYRIVMAVVLLAACDIHARGTGVDNPVTQVVVFPDTLTLDPFQSFQFRAFGRTDAGDSVPVSVRWVASAGAISQAGTYSADTSAADAVLTATLSSSAVSGTSRVKKRRVVQLLINPKNTALKVGGSQQFSVYGRNNLGDSVSVPVTYLARAGPSRAGVGMPPGRRRGHTRDRQPKRRSPKRYLHHYPVDHTSRLGRGQSCRWHARAGRHAATQRGDVRLGEQSSHRSSGQLVQ